jgi:short-subunit dehydrogenase
MELRGARVLVTGATGGLGQAIAAELGRAGAELVVTGRRAEALSGLADELGARVVTADLAEPGAAAALAAEVGDVDVLVANAALPASGDLLDFEPERIDRCLQVNLHAPVQLARALAPGMVERGRGHLLFVSSLSGITATPGSSIYSATKFGLRGFALGARQDLHGTGVGVSLVSPGFIRDAGMFADSGVTLPSGTRTSTPGQVAAAVLRAITRNRAELVVAPPELRVGSRLLSLVPTLNERVLRLAGSRKVADAMAAGQRDKR